jgi:hypothetical protein
MSELPRCITVLKNVGYTLIEPSYMTGHGKAEPLACKIQALNNKVSRGEVVQMGENSLFLKPWILYCSTM